MIIIMSIWEEIFGRLDVKTNLMQTGQTFRLKKERSDYNYLKCFRPTMSAKLNLG